MTDPFTAAELRAIGERIKRDRLRPVNVNVEAEVDRARLYAALERLIAEGDGCFCINVPMQLLYKTKDAAIDAMLKGGVE